MSNYLKFERKETARVFCLSWQLQGKSIQDRGGKRDILFEAG